jgi:hypothetical protein
MLNLILLKNLISETYVLTESDVSELYAVSESVIDEVFSNKGFPKEEFVKSVLKRFRLVNTNSTSGKNLKCDEAIMGEQVALSCLVNALGGACTSGGRRITAILRFRCTVACKFGVFILKSVDKPTTNYKDRYNL